jgi:hypothetical protein
VKQSIRTFVLAGVLGCAAGAAHAEDTAQFIFADVGTTHTGFIFPGDPRIGREVVLARIFLVVEVFPGADAADFDTDLTLPISAAEGATPVVALTGTGLGWSGSGTFTYMTETTLHNGTFIQTLFGAATSPMDTVIHEDSYVELVFAPGPQPSRRRRGSSRRVGAGGNRPLSPGLTAGVVSLPWGSRGAHAARPHLYVLTHRPFARE